MACTSFVGTPASLRAPAATRSARARVSVRADASSAATCVVTPATVGSRSGSASVKGTVRKQNEDRFASYVRPPPRSFARPRWVSALAVVATVVVARRRRPIRPLRVSTIRDSTSRRVSRESIDAPARFSSSSLPYDARAVCRSFSLHAHTTDTIVTTPLL